MTQNLIFAGTFRLTQDGEPDAIRIGNAFASNCRVVGVGGNSRQRRLQVRKWKQKHLRVTPYHSDWGNCFVEIRPSGAHTSGHIA